MLDINVVAILLGLFVGFVMSVTGAGGAILSLPLLVIFMHLGMREAAPIGLLAVSLAAGVSSVIGIKQGVVRYKAASLLALMGVVMSPIGVVLAHQVSATFLQMMFILVLLYVSLNAFTTSNKVRNPQGHLFKPQVTPCEINPSTSKLFWTASCTKRLLLTGSVAGLLSGLLGVGGGFVVVPTMQKMSNMENRMVVATALAMTALVSMVGVISYAGYNAINWVVAVPFVSATLLGSLLGRGYANKITLRKSKLIFASMSLLIAILMMIRLM
ncbi:sulfite exporter TauE/SafE family protein [Methylotenera sp.]|uniref:sulfite exporter TauE/SafE family protein n=1 Tax=Methylotenera sp. TaxID=2051956 RepID=UPI0024899F18|nr:sulfite exporter TauE/SafE family protein [Methylotenera sp.]MDI1299079.1 sulfite exporter TauE/SafE family protein [Methylotenera sp.]